MRALWSSLGSVALAVVASACCWLPLVLLSLGIGTATIASVTTSIESMRPILALVALPLLGLAWYFAFRRRPAGSAASSAGDDCCAVPTTATRRVSRLNRVMLPIATVLVIAMIAFPHQLFGFVSSMASASDVDVDVVAQRTADLRLAVPGMT